MAIPSWIGTMSTSQRAVMPCSWGVKAGMVHVCGWQVKLCDPHVIHRPSLSALEMQHDKVLYKFTLLYFTLLSFACVLWSRVSWRPLLASALVHCANWRIIRMTKRRLVPSLKYSNRLVLWCVLCPVCLRTTSVHLAWPCNNAERSHWKFSLHVEC